MAIQYSSGGGNATVTITYTATKIKVDAVLEDAAHGLWNMGFGNHGADGTRLWASLTSQEKLNLVDDFVKRELTRKAKDYHVTASIDAAKATALAEEGNYDL
jgi:hypothetical protein